jgi:hypothetical protein
MLLPAKLVTEGEQGGQFHIREEASFPGSPDCKVNWKTGLDCWWARTSRAFLNYKVALGNWCLTDISVIGLNSPTMNLAEINDRRRRAFADRLLAVSARP